MCRTFTDQKAPEKFDVIFRCQPRGCRQSYWTLLIDIEMPSTRDSSTRGPLGSPRHRESQEVPTWLGNYDSHQCAVSAPGVKPFERCGALSIGWTSRVSKGRVLAEGAQGRPFGASDLIELGVVQFFFFAKLPLPRGRRIKNLLWAVHATGRTGCIQLERIKHEKPHDLIAVNPKALTISSEAAGYIGMLSARDCHMGA
ncbi:hypothetical protein EVAR_34299_1 [Eumeta japonica]|uniref:Uncharacterized protein n=1 Tax=Eumeta variegata TaxID=151549 RepID=A0A4C1VX60_EUMVA|nr:hypothetical protein EVAR_34299_1 [Eumeta japonica]